VPVEVVYVFDGGDAPPAGLDAQTVATSPPLTIYHAWNMALAAVTTPLVMNLNLDDRLAPDAVKKLAAHMAAQKAMLAGGDWRITYSQDETDAVTPCVAARDVPFAMDCPPAVRANHRLGSGTGESLTFGPAVLWQMAVHATVPRYPWRLDDGSPVQSVGDGLFWSILGRLGVPMARLPMVIGNYHFHPQSQAEYRVREDLAAMLPRVKKI
jgi:hypothetical protein